MKSITKKYLICIPLIILSLAAIAFATQGIIHVAFAYLGILTIGVCIVVLHTEMHYYAPEEGRKFYASVGGEESDGKKDV